MLDCLFYDKHVLKCENVLIFNCQQSVNKYETQAADWTKEENRIRLPGSRLELEHAQFQTQSETIFRSCIEQIEQVKAYYTR